MPDELIKAICVAAEMRGGSAHAHATLMLTVPDEETTKDAHMVA